jgi:hypothetical protein
VELSFRIKFSLSRKFSGYELPAISKWQNVMPYCKSTSKTIYFNMKTILLPILIMCFISCGKKQDPNKEQSSEINSNQQISQMAERIKISELRNALLKLENGKTEYKFIGITSNGIDCIYFVYENGKFNIEFEAMSEQQIPFIEKLREFAKTNKFKNLMTTYNNQPQYKSEKPAPVLRVETNSSLDEMTKIAENIQAEIFKNTENTIYDVVP